MLLAKLLGHLVYFKGRREGEEVGKFALVEVHVGTLVFLKGGS
jgi:hypothetical protein